MKRFIPLFILVVLGFTGCNIVAPILDPIVGTWEGPTVLLTTTTLVFGADRTCSETTTIASVIASTKNGTFTSNATTFTRNWSDGSSDTNSFSFNSNNSEMIVVRDGGGLVVTFERQ